MRLISSITGFFNYVVILIPSMLKGTMVTLNIFFYTLLLALPLGLFIALLGIIKIKPIRFIVNIYIWILRGTPLLLQLFFVYFGLPYLGVRLDSFTSVIVAFVLNYAAYFAEIYRAGIESIDSGQYEAAKALGLTYSQSMKNIILPQTIKRIIPPMANEIITLVKDTALATFITVPELLKSAKDAVNRDSVATAYIVAALIYLLLTLILTIFFKNLEKRNTID